MILRRREMLAGAIAALAAPPAWTAATGRRRIGEIRRLDPALDAIVDRDAPIEVLGTGYRWAEGPVWVRRGGYLLFSDVPSNTMWRWSARTGMTVFMRPSGLAGVVPDGFNEAGSNGLDIDARSRLLIADSGNRAIVRVDLGTRTRTILADRFGGRKFNSPNDLVASRAGAIYFTDPPYGLKGLHASPLRELDRQGVYRLGPDGALTVVDNGLHLPNGIALSPDERTLYVALSDQTRPHILAYTLDADGGSGPSGVFYDAVSQMGPGRAGVPDGLAVAADGHLFATGPGGVHVITPAGRLLGVIATGKAVANCCFGEDGRGLFMTSHDLLARVRLRRSAWSVR